MALYIPHSIFRLARLQYVRPETFGPPYYVLKLGQCLKEKSYVPRFIETIQSLVKNGKAITDGG